MRRAGALLAGLTVLLCGPVPAGVAERAAVAFGTGAAATARARPGPEATRVRVGSAPDDVTRPVAPAPPPVLLDPPPGRRPGAAAGLRGPGQCDPPAADEPGPDADSAARRMRLADVHRLATGAGRLIAVIDTGVAPGPRFGDRLTGGGDYLTGGSGLDDCDGHGTAVAGIIAASPGGRDGGGVSGMAPGARLLSIRQSSPAFQVMGPDGVSRPAGDVHTLADAVVLAVRSGADVVNISEAVCLPAARAASQGALIQAALRLAARADVVVVAAAGNAGGGNCAPSGQEPADQVSLPGWYGDDVLTVGAVGPDDDAADFTVPGAWVDVAAPGTDLRSLAVGGGTTDVDLRGTSFAAPWVSGLAALVRERFPRLSAAQVVDRILATARRPSAGEGLRTGHGVIDPVAALTAVPDVLDPARETTTFTATLADEAPRPAEPSDDPGALVAGVLVGACAAAGWRMRRRSPHS